MRTGIFICPFFLTLNVIDFMYVKNFCISPIGDTLEIWVKIPETLYYENITLERIAIQDWKNYTVTYPDNPQLEFNDQAMLEEFRIPRGSKEFKISLCLKDLEKFFISTKGIIYMYIKTEGMPNDTYLSPLNCFCFKDVTVYMTINWHIFYEQAIKLFTRMNDCDGSARDELIDMEIKRRLFVDALHFKEFGLANKFWDDIMHQDYKNAGCFTGCYTPVSSVSSSNCKSCG